MGKEKIWLIIINEKIYGPYTIKDLKRNAALTPDTYAKKINDKEWKKIKDIPELAALFEEEEEHIQQEQTKFEISREKEIILAQTSIDPGHFWLWLIIFLIIIFYFLYRLYA